MNTYTSERIDDRFQPVKPDQRSNQESLPTTARLILSTTKNGQELDHWWIVRMDQTSELWGPTDNDYRHSRLPFGEFVPRAIDTNPSKSQKLAAAELLAYLIRQNDIQQATATNSILSPLQIKRLERQLEREQRFNRAQAAKYQILEVAFQLELHPIKRRNLWLCRCPFSNHHLSIQPKWEAFQCEPCRVRGGPVELSQLIESKRSQNPSIETLRGWSATKIMGWKLAPSIGSMACPVYRSEGLFGVSSWRPDQNPAQLAMIIDKENQSNLGENLEAQEILRLLWVNSNEL